MITTLLARPPRQHRRRRTRNPVNAGGLRAVVAMIELFPERWQQGTFQDYHDGHRTYCFASWTCHLAGYRVQDFLSQDPLDRDRGLGMRVVEQARTLLGLSEQQILELAFFGVGWAEHPTPAQLRDKVTAVTGVHFGPEPEPEARAA